MEKHDQIHLEELEADDPGAERVQKDRLSLAGRWRGGVASREADVASRGAAQTKASRCGQLDSVQKPRAQGSKA